VVAKAMLVARDTMSKDIASPDAFFTVV
jgi:hypothetical protein